MNHAKSLQLFFKGLLCPALLLVISPISAFDIPSHIQITRGGLEPITVPQISPDAKFTDNALEEIIRANEAVDSIYAGSAALWREERHFTDDRFLDSSRRIRDLKNDILDALNPDAPRGPTARLYLGRALHTIQDFYSHSNWIDVNGNTVNSTFGTTLMADPSAAVQPCLVGNPNTKSASFTTDESSAYVRFDFSGDLFEDDTYVCGPVPAGKCWHGAYTATCPGVNKDKPGFTGHNPAKSVATTSTENYTQMIIDTLLAADNEAGVAALLGLPPSLAFVVDDTGSMGEEIAGVKRSVISIATRYESLPEEFRPDKLILTRFGDPDVGPAFVTREISALQSRLNTLSPSGGGDCPELSQRALLETIDEASFGSLILLYTDASAKDAGLVNTVSARAQEKNARIIPVITGSCSPVDPAYFRNAEDTGGQLFIVNPSEVDSLVDLIIPYTTGDLATILSRKIDATAAPISISVPVDSSISNLVISVTSASSANLRLYRPNGDQAMPTDGDTSVTTLSNNTIYTVSEPLAGGWRIEVDGNGEATIQVRGNSSLSLERFEFVRANFIDIHGGFFPIPGQPPLGETTLGRATMRGDFTEATFSLYDESGNFIEEIELNQNQFNEDPERFLGSFSIPTVPFRVVVTGGGGLLLDYRREYPYLFRPQSVLVAQPTPTADSQPLLFASAGATTEIIFEVSNLGTASATYDLTATNNLGFSVTPAASPLTVPANETVEVSLSLEVPEAIDGDTPIDVSLVATNTTDTSIFNSATAQLVVTAIPPLDCNPDGEVRISVWPPNNKFKSIDVGVASGVKDGSDDTINVTVNSVLQDEPVFGNKGAGKSSPDAVIDNNSGSIQVRAERSGKGKGRVYKIDFTAEKGGASCAGTIYAEVPHNASSMMDVLDDGTTFDSTITQ